MARKSQPGAVVETPPPPLEALARDVYALLVGAMGDAKAKALWRSIAAKPGPHKNPEKVARQAEIAEIIEAVGNKRPNERHKIISTFADIATERKLGKRNIRNETAYSKGLEANKKRIQRIWNDHQARRNRLFAAALLAPDRPKLGGLYDLGAAALATKKDKNPP
jgi:hypothetical protein